MEDNKGSNAVRNMVALKLLKSFLKDENAEKAFMRNIWVYPQKNDVGYICGVEYDVNDTKYFKIKSYGKCNFINITNGKMYSENWYDDCSLLKNGILAIEMKGSCTFLKDGKRITELWFTDYTNFHQGIAGIKPIGKDKWMYIKDDGKLLCDLSFDSIGMFHEFSNKNEYTTVMNDGKYNILSIQGKLIGKIWYDRCSFVDDFGFSLVQLNGKYNFLNINGKHLLSVWFDKLDYFDRNGISRGTYKGQDYIINLKDKSVKRV